MGIYAYRTFAQTTSERDPWWYFSTWCFGLILTFLQHSVLLHFRAKTCQHKFSYHIFLKLSLLIDMSNSGLCLLNRSIWRNAKTAKVPFRSHQNQNIAYNICPSNCGRNRIVHWFQLLRYHYPGMHFCMLLCGWTAFHDMARLQRLLYGFDTGASANACLMFFCVNKSHTIFWQMLHCVEETV
jgi:hypothetical protein